MAAGRGLLNVGLLSVSIVESAHAAWQKGDFQMQVGLQSIWVQKTQQMQAAGHLSNCDPRDHGPGLRGRVRFKLGTSA